MIDVRHRLRAVGLPRLAVAQVAPTSVVALWQGQTLHPVRLDAQPDKTTSPLPDPGHLQDFDVSWRKLPKRVLRDQKDIWLFPTQLARGRYWLPTIGVVGGRAALIAADPHAVPHFRSHAGNLDDVNDVFDGKITNAAIAFAPLSILIVGHVRHDCYAVKTAFVGGRSVRGRSDCGLGAERNNTANETVGDRARISVQRHFFPWRDEFPFRSCHRGIFRGDDHRSTLSTS